VKTRLVRIGNSRGVRLPKPIIEEAGLSDKVELRVRRGAIVIQPAEVRSGWAEAAARLATAGEGQLLGPPAPTRFDREEWEW
jgi:antitoxin MazE